MNMKSSPVPLLMSAAAVLALSVWCWHKRRSRKLYVKVGRVKKLFFYPVKSLKGFEVEKVKCTKHATEYNGVKERSFMVVDADGVLVSQRQEPTLVLLSTLISDGELIISSGSGEPLKVRIEESFSPEEKILTCRIHTDYVKAVDCGEEASRWFQAYLKRSDVRLVHYSTGLEDRQYGGNDPVFKKFKKEHPVTFQDASAVHIITQSSLDQLNARLTEGVSVLNFRPDVLVDGCSAFEEDNWKFIRFSSGAEVQSCFPCGRCIVTTVDPSSGTKTDKEPLVTLRKFRMPRDEALKKRINYSPCFGLVCCAEKHGDIQVNDDVFAVVEKDLFQFVEK